MKFLASEKLSAHRYKTPEGYLVCTDAILARTGKQTYRKNEIFDTQDEEEVEIDRPAEEVFNAQTVASFENKPVTVEHPAEDVNVSNYKEHAVGFARDIRRGTANGQDVLLGNLVITDGKTIEEIENGEHTELSCGYDCDVSEQDLVQRNIRGNHIALCEHGRAGIARIVDSEENRKAEDMVKKHAINKLGKKFTLEEKGGKIVATNESGRTKEYASWDEAEKEFSKRGIAIKDDFFGDELIESGSEEALRENIKTEIEAGKDPKQAAAIAYRVQRENDSSDRVDDRLITLYYIYTAGGTHADESGRLTENPNSYLYFETEKEALQEADRIGRKTGIRCFVGKTKGWSDSGDVPNAKAHEPGMAAMDTVKDLLSDYELQKGAKIVSHDGAHRYKILKVDGDYLTVLGENGIVSHIKKDFAKRNFNAVRDSDHLSRFEVHTRDKNGSCRVDIVRAKDYIDAVKKARKR